MIELVCTIFLPLLIAHQMNHLETFLPVDLLGIIGFVWVDIFCVLSNPFDEPGNEVIPYYIAAHVFFIMIYIYCLFLGHNKKVTKKLEKKLEEILCHEEPKKKKQLKNLLKIY